MSADDSGFCELLLSKHETITKDQRNIFLDEGHEGFSVDCDAENNARFSPECPFFDLVENLWTDRSVDTLSDYPDLRSTPSSMTRNLTDAEIERYFPVKPPPFHGSAILSSSPKKSSLTLALEQATVDGRLLQTGLFADYSKYDGRPAALQRKSASVNISNDPSSRCFTVWFWRVLDIPKISICVQPCAGTTVAQFIGLSLWQYFNDAPSSGHSPILPHTIDQFDEKLVDRISVYILDSPDEGVDSDFPPLESSDLIHKYEFEALALVEREHVALVDFDRKESSSVFVTIHMAQGVSTYRFTTDARLSEVLERVVHRRDLRQHGGYEYHLESWPFSGDTVDALPQQPLSTHDQLSNGRRLDLHLRLRDVIDAGFPLRFVLIRDNSRFDPVSVGWAVDDDYAPAKSCVPPERLRAALQLRQYRVTWLKGLFPREVQLTVSADGIRIDYVTTIRRPKLFSKPTRPVILGLEQLADCHLICPSSSGTCAPTQELATTMSDNAAYVSEKVQIRVAHLKFRGISLEETTPTTSSLEGHVCGPVTTSSKSLEGKGNSAGFQYLWFESQWTRARAICNQLNLILEHRGGNARQLYMRHHLTS